MNLYKLTEELKGKILGCEMELNLIEQDLQSVEMDLCFLDKIRDDLISNINLLGSGDVVVRLKQYHKSISNLKEIKKKIIAIRNLQNNLRNKLDIKVKEYERFFAQFEEHSKALKKNSNILSFKKKEK